MVSLLCLELTFLNETLILSGFYMFKDKDKKTQSPDGKAQRSNLQSWALSGLKERKFKYGRNKHKEGFIFAFRQARHKVD